MCWYKNNHNNHNKVVLIIISQDIIDIIDIIRCQKKSHKIFEKIDTLNVAPCAALGRLSSWVLSGARPAPPAHPRFLRPRSRAMGARSFAAALDKDNEEGMHVQSPRKGWTLGRRLRG